MAGQPTLYTPELAHRICSLISKSDKGLASILKENDDLPCEETVYAWLRTYPEFSEWYTQAREDQAGFVIDQTFEIADDGRNDWMEKHDREGNAIGWQANGEAVARSKLRIEQRFRAAEKLAPKKYGVKQQIDMKAHLAVTDMTDDEIRAELAALTAQGFVMPVAEPADDGSDLV